MDSSTLTAIVIAVVAIVVIAAIAFTVRRQRTSRLRSNFGPEYDRVVDDAGSRARAEAELHDRQKRVKHLDIRPLSVSDRDRFVSSWRMIQADFVDQPLPALAKADDLINEVMRARGYPMEDFDQRSADLSVDHPTVVQNYRAGRAIALRHRQGEADTEDLRQAMIHFRSLFDELVGDAGADVQRRVS